MYTIAFCLLFSIITHAAADKIWKNGFVTKSQMYQHIKKFGIKPKDNPANGFVYYRCGHNPKDLITGEDKSESYFATGIANYYAVTLIDETPIAVSLYITHLPAKTVRYKDGAFITEFPVEVEITSVFSPTHGSTAPSVSDDNGEILADPSAQFNKPAGFKKPNDLVHIFPGYLERSTCKATRVASATLFHLKL